jgi:hypothetical protein
LLRSGYSDSIAFALASCLKQDFQDKGMDGILPPSCNFFNLFNHVQDKYARTMSEQWPPSAAMQGRKIFRPFRR